MDDSLEKDTARKLEQLTEHPDIDLHLRIQTICRNGSPNSSLYRQDQTSRR